MTREIIEDIGLAIQRGPKLELGSYTGHNYSFLDLCKDFEVLIGGLKTKNPIFIIEYGNHDLVFGQSFLNLVKFNLKYKPDSIFGTIMYS